MLLFTFFRSIKQRQEAVAELSTNDSPSISLLRESILHLPDLERMLCSAYHKKVCNVVVLLAAWLSDILMHPHMAVLSIRVLFTGQVSEQHS